MAVCFIVDVMLCTESSSLDRQSLLKQVRELMCNLYLCTYVGVVCAYMCVCARARTCVYAYVYVYMCMHIRHT